MLRTIIVAIALSLCALCASLLAEPKAGPTSQPATAPATITGRSGKVIVVFDHRTRSADEYELLRQLTIDAINTVSDGAQFNVSVPGRDRPIYAFQKAYAIASAETRQQAIDFVRDRDRQEAYSKVDGITKNLVGAFGSSATEIIFFSIGKYDQTSEILKRVRQLKHDKPKSILHVTHCADPDSKDLAETDSREFMRRLAEVGGGEYSAVSVPKRKK
jgi:hypothetical protein